MGATGDYRNTNIRLENKGLDFVHPSDIVPPGKWTTLINVRNTVEGLITTRPGITSYVNGSDTNHQVRMIRRLTSTVLLVQNGDDLYRDNTFISSGWPSDQSVSMVRYRPALSSSEWMYIASEDKMAKVAADGTEYNWGIEGNDTACDFVLSGNAGDEDSSLPGAQPYDYRYTYYSSTTGAESNPSPTSSSTLAAVSQAINVSVVASADPQVDSIRIYRRGGTITTVWKLSITTTNTTQTIEDTNGDGDIATSVELSDENDVPFTTVDSSGNTLYGTPLPQVWGPFQGSYIFACGDPVRPGYIYWTNQDGADGAGANNNLQVTPPQEPLINGFIYSANPFVWTRDNLYALDYGGPTATPTFVPRLIPIGMGLAATNGFTANGPGGVVFVAKDGIYMTDCYNKLTSLTGDAMRPLFRGQQVGDYYPIDWDEDDSIFIEYMGQEVHFLFTDTQGAVKHFFYDMEQQRWQEFQSSIARTFIYGDENQANYQLLAGSTLGDVFSLNVEGETTDDGAAISCTATTGSFDFGIPLTYKEMGNLLVDADSGTTAILVTPMYNNGITTGSATSIETSSARTTTPISLEDTYARNIALSFTWQGSATLYQATFLWREDEEAVKHWEHPPTSHNLPGWQHLRDGYIGLRSSETVTLTINIDGTDYTYSLDSTGGARRKVYVKFEPVKGKMFGYKLESTADFRFYGEDTQLNVKSWNTKLGYETIYPFLAVGQATFLRKNAGT